MKQTFDYVGRELAKLYLVLLGIAILIVFPIAVFVEVFYLLAMIGDALEIRGGLGIVYFFGCLVVLLVLFVLASRHVRPVAMRLLDEVRKSAQDLN